MSKKKTTKEFIADAIIDCKTPKIFCPFCKERVISFEEYKEVTPAELYDLLSHNYNKIILIT